MTDNPEHPVGPRPLPFDTPPSDSAPMSSRSHPIADDRDHRLDPRSVTASRLAGAIASAVLSFLVLIPTLVTSLASGFGVQGWVVALGVWLVLAAILFAWTLTWPALRYRHASYRVNEHGVEIRSGVLFRSVVSVPRSRVQHTDVSRGPIERNFDLATLIIHTAGTQHASVSLGGLTEATANAIRDYLVDVGGDDAV